MKPIVAICGRPNVGKSTLFNRLIGERKAVVAEEPGTTRDRLFGDTTWNGVDFILVDTGGIEMDEEKLKQDVLNQAKVAISDSDLIVFLVDCKDGITPADKKALDMIRKTGKKTILAVNKVDNSRFLKEAENFRNLGIKDIFMVSAIHGTGTGDLLDEIVEQIKDITQKEETEEVETIGVAILGRPNVGKSTLLNKLVKQERVIISDIPGTTRDTIDTNLIYKNKTITLFDTAGIKKRGKIQKGIEKYSLIRALGAIDESDIVFLLIDACEGITKQDMHIASYALEKAKGIVIVVNKWDAAKNQDMTTETFIGYLQKKIPFLYWAPVVFISAQSGKNVTKVLDQALEIYQEMDKRVPIKEINELIARVSTEKRPPSRGSKETKIYYSTKIKSKIPTFIIFTSQPKAIHFSYKRYLENKLREKFGFIGLPIRLIFRSKKE